MSYPDEATATGVLLADPLRLNSAGERLCFPIRVSQSSISGLPEVLGVAVEDDLFPGTFDALQKGQSVSIVGSLKTVTNAEKDGLTEYELIGKEVYYA